MTDLAEIVCRFSTEGRFVSASPIGSGHINDSWLVMTDKPGEGNYVLQRINHAIFRNVPELIGNILRVTQHIDQRLRNRDRDLSWFRIIRLIPAGDGGHFYRDSRGDFWRLYNHIGNSRSYDIVGSPGLAFEAGKAFGTFQYLASDIDVACLRETIPRFHDIGWRLEAFRDAVRRDPAGRAKDCREEIAFVEARADDLHVILRLGVAGQIPVRVTHNDTKFNNVLFDENDRAVSVVDLDTVMPGYLLYDFGDAIRTGTNTGAEDEADLSKAGIDLGLFEAYSRGYLSMARRFLAEAETDHLAFSARFMTCLIGLRFLTDHLDGDRYFKTRFPGHNLQRARAQFRMAESIEAHLGEMQEIIRTLYRQDEKSSPAKPFKP